MAMLLVRSAPGVWAMSSRLMRVVGVTVLTLAVLRSVVTLVVCSMVPIWSSMWRTGAVSEASVMDCFAVSKPGCEMVMV
ncbi:hypothetical protein RBB78_11755 [Tunturiibacter empetritectus]|uniref:hypothetical protein n=1 Tax=Tunturiibacter empetritectus TaxID=3069691 RepID=UPI003D9B8BAA